MNRSEDNRRRNFIFKLDIKSVKNTPTLIKFRLHLGTFVKENRF